MRHTVDMKVQLTTLDLRMERVFLHALAAGQLDGMTAIMTGKLKVEGDMSNAMQLQGVLSKLK